MKISKRIKLVSALILTAALIWILSAQVNLVNIIGLLKAVPLHILAAAFVLYILGHLGRTVRFYRLLGWKNSFHDLFSIVCLHNLFINTLPARTGEFSYLYLTKKRDVPLAKSGSMLIIARILDLISIALILLLAVLFAENLPAFITKFSHLVTALLLACLLLLFSLSYFGSEFINALDKIFSFFGLGKSKAVKLLLEKGNEAAESFKVLKSRKAFSEHLFYSLFIWGVRFVLFWLITIGLGIEVGIWIGIIGITLPLLSTFLPIQGLGGFGTLEGAWTISFMSLGISKEAAILSGFGFHIVFLMFAVITGVYGFLVPSILKKL